MPELRSVFADNLKSLVRQEKSIAHVCRVLSINRQQFNRYLSAETIPSKRNIGKIADYFGIEQGALFVPMTENASAKGEPAPEPLFESLGAAFNGETKHLRDGHYFFYIPYPAPIPQCLRGLLIVKRELSRTRFSSVLNFQRKYDADSPRNWTRFSGLVRERDGKLLFLGTVRGEPGDIFMINVAPVYASNQKLFAGLSTSARAGEISARRIAIEVVRDHRSLLQMARQCAMIDMASPDIDPRIRAAISSENGIGSAILLPREHVQIISA
ncbi:MAG: helix-turn-helix transcriptional regulator [Rhizobiaceae bacterium]